MGGAIVESEQVSTEPSIETTPVSDSDVLSFFENESLINPPLSKGMVRVTIFTLDISQLANDLSGMGCRGVLGSDSSASGNFVTLDVPEETLNAISELPSVLGLYVHPDSEDVLSFDDARISEPDAEGAPPVDPASTFSLWKQGTAQAWSNGFTGTGVKVAVPYAIDFGNPDLQGRQARNTDAGSPYYNWPIVFDFASMNNYLSTGGNTSGTWYVDTSAERGLNYTEMYDMTINTETEWDTLPSYSNSWQPKMAGNAESLVLDGLTPGNQYVFAVRATDEAGNMGMISNSQTATAMKDTTPPLKITDLVATPGLNHGTAMLSWTAPGDDENVGSAASYQIKYSDLPIANIHCFRHLSYDIENIIVPAASETPEAFAASDLPAGRTLYFAVVSVDEAGNWGEVSNTVSTTITEDTAKPQTISGLTGTSVGAAHSGVILNWTAPRDEGATGSSCVRYEGRFSATPDCD